MFWNTYGFYLDVKGSVNISLGFLLYTLYHIVEIVECCGFFFLRLEHGRVVECFTLNSVA